jgi:hypothetical protein
MRYIVEVAAKMERADVVDANGGPDDTLSKIAERFKPIAVYQKADTFHPGHAYIL